MNAARILNRLNALGITVNVNGDKLRVFSPERGAITPDMQRVIAEHKADLIDLLTCDRAARLESLKSEVNALYDELEDLAESIGQNHPQFDAQLKKCEAKLAEYKALQDLMMEFAE